MMQALHRVFVRELQRVRTNKIYLATLTLLPAVSILIFASLFSGGIPQKLAIAVVDEDHSALSRKVVEMIAATSEVNVRYMPSNIYEAERLIRQGKAYAMVVIPRHFERDAMSLSPTSIATYISGANILTNGLISKGLLSAISTFTTGYKINLLVNQGLASQQAETEAMAINFDRHILFNPYTNYNYYLLPFFLPMMLLIFTTTGTIFAIGSELRDSTAAEWLATANGSLGVALAGKLLPVIMAMSAMSAMIFGVLFTIVKTPINPFSWTFLIYCIILVLSYISIAIITISLTTNMRLSLSLAGGYAVMAFSLSGLTFPSMAMHEAMQWLGHLFPFTYFVRATINQVVRGTPIAYSLGDIASMLGFLLPAIALLPRLKRISLNRQYWSKS